MIAACNVSASALVTPPDGILLLSSRSELTSTLIESDGTVRNSSDAEPRA